MPKERTKKIPEVPNVGEDGILEPGKVKDPAGVETTADQAKQKSKEKDSSDKRSGNPGSSTSKKAQDQTRSEIQNNIEENRSDFMKKLIKEALKEMGPVPQAEKRRREASEDESMPILTPQGHAKRRRNAPDIVAPRHGAGGGQAAAGLTSRQPRALAHEISSDEGEITDDESEAFAIDEDQVDAFLESANEDDPDGVMSDAVLNDWIDELGKELQDSEETGPPLAENLAKLVENVIAKRMTKDKIKTLMEKTTKPSNATILTAPRVNQQIWMKMKPETRSKDIKLTKISEKVAKGLIAVARVAEGLGSMKEKVEKEGVKKELKTLTRQALEALQLGAASLQDLSQKRRSEIKIDLNVAYKQLCNVPDKENELLFGQDLPARVKELNEARALGRKMENWQTNKSSTYYPSFKSRRPPFLEGRRHGETLNFRIESNVQSNSSEIKKPGVISKQMQLNHSNVIDHESKIINHVLDNLPGSNYRFPSSQGEQRTGRAPLPEVRQDQPGPSQGDVGRQEEARPGLVEVGEFDQVWESFKTKTLRKASKDVELFEAGRLRKFIDFWKTLTSDPHILALILGTPIELEEFVTQSFIPEPYRYPLYKQLKIQVEIDKMLKKGVIVRVEPSRNQFVSNIFTRDKNDNTLRIILDLSDFNEFVTYRHFKMDTLQHAIDLMFQDCWFASIDWKDAYYCVPIGIDFRKYLTFEWQGQRFQYTCYPNGLSSAPRNFTKLTRVLFSELRKKGHINTSYIDDCLLIGTTKEHCKQNVYDTVILTEETGFVIHPVKSVLEPVQEITYLGFILRSTDMTVRLTPSKAEKLQKACQKLISKQTVTIQELAEVTGMMVASFPGQQFGPLFYRNCDNLKNKALKLHKGNYRAKLNITTECIEDLLWWDKNVQSNVNNLLKPKPSVFLESDASNSGFGGCEVQKGTRRPLGKPTGGNWTKDEAMLHINALELLGAWYIIQSYCKECTNTHIRIAVDNTTTVAYLNHMGGTKTTCHRIAQRVWRWCYERNNWITCVHLAGKLNVIADRQSRSEHDNMEWKLNTQLFQKISEKFGKPEVDLFASRLNYQVPRYFSWKPDPGAEQVDALAQDWSGLNFYAFPPFSLIGKVLNKINTEDAEGLLIVPYWPTQFWFSLFTSMITEGPFLVFSRDQPTLSHPRRSLEELPTRLRLLVARVSPQCMATSHSARRRSNSSQTLGEGQLRESTKRMSQNGQHFVIKGEWISCPHI